jgi:hypothetical protein
MWKRASTWRRSQRWCHLQKRREDPRKSRRSEVIQISARGDQSRGDGDGRVANSAVHRPFREWETKELDLLPFDTQSWWGKHREIMIHASLLRCLIRTKHTPPLPTLRAFARHNSANWPRTPTRNCYRRSLHPRITTRTMASIHIDDKVKALINNSYPQTQDAGDDPHKLSSIAYPHVEVRSKDTLDRMNMQLIITTVHPA